MTVMPQHYRSQETSPVCQWLLQVQDSLLYQAGYLETDLQLDSEIRVHPHQSSENQGKKNAHRLKPVLFFLSALKRTIPEFSRLKEMLENIRNHL